MYDKFIISMLLFNIVHALHIEVTNPPELREYKDQTAKKGCIQSSNVSNKVFSFLYPQQYVGLQQGSKSHDISLSPEVTKYIESIQPTDEPGVEITEVSIVDQIIRELTAANILPDTFLTGRGIANDGGIPGKRDQANKSSQNLADYTRPFAPGPIDTGSLFEFIDYSIFVNQEGLTIKCMTDLFSINPLTAELNFRYSRAYPNFRIANLHLDLPEGQQDFDWYANLLVRHNRTRFTQELGYTRFEVGQRMGKILIPANLRPEDDEQPLLSFMLRTIKAVKLGLTKKDNLEKREALIPHVAFTLY
jgi:hypothetical protein